MCGSGSGVAAVTIAVDRETADASRGLKWLRETVTYTCVPYVYNWSQDVEKCTLDLVLSSSTRTNTVQATAVASKPRRKSLQDPLPKQREMLRNQGGGDPQTPKPERGRMPWVHGAWDATWNMQTESAMRARDCTA